jgi:hypothetical protein
MRLFPPRRVSGLLLLVAFVLNLGGVVLYSASTGTAFGWVVETPTYHAWERALIMGSYVAAALGTAVLEPAVGEAGAAILGRLAATAFDGHWCRARHGGAQPDATRPGRRFGAAAVRGRGTPWCGNVGESTGAGLNRVDGNNLERRLAGGPSDRHARRLLLPGPARHSAAPDQHPAHPTGGRADRSVTAGVTAARAARAPSRRGLAALWRRSSQATKYWRSGRIGLVHRSTAPAPAITDAAGVSASTTRGSSRSTSTASGACQYIPTARVDRRRSHRIHRLPAAEQSFEMSTSPGQDSTRP